MTTRTPRSYYYAGQGLLWAARLHAETGAPMGYRPLGNCPSVNITPVFAAEGKAELLDGVKQIARSDPATVAGRLTASLENLSLANIAWLAGDGVDLLPASPVPDYVTYGYLGAFAYLPHPLVDPDETIAVIHGATVLTAYTTAIAPWDYYIDEDAGLVCLNDGATQPLDNLTAVPGERIPLLVNYTRKAQAAIATVPASIGLWSFVFQGLNDVDGKVVTVRVPMAHVRRNLKQFLINEDVASVPLEAALLLDLRAAHPTIFEVDTIPQGFAAHGFPGV
jgi:hypothetical protein